MLKTLRSKQLPDFFLCVIAFLIPFPFIYGAVAIVLLFITWLLQSDFKSTFINLKNRKMLWVWIAYFLLHAVSYTYSDNKDQSLFDVQTKLSILLLPIIIGAGMNIQKPLLERIMFFFVCGTTAVAIICMTKATLLWYDTKNIEVLFYHKLIEGLEINAVYGAWYTFFAIALLLLFPWITFFTAKFKFLRIILLIIQIVFFILLSARMLIALFFIILIPYYIVSLFQKKSISYLQLGIVFSFFIILAVAIIVTENPIKKRYEEIIQKDLKTLVFKDYHNVSETEFNNLTLRIFMWRIGLANMEEKNLWLSGTGNGDAQKLQNDKIKEYGIIGWDPNQDAALINANLHNMLMQSLLMIGVPGAILFLLMAFVPLFNLRKVHGSKVFWIFHISAIAFMMQESALQTQAGVVYYSFFSCIFWNLFYNRNDNEPANYDIQITSLK
jgi:hypothetical protein